MKTKTIKIPIYKGTLRMYYAPDLSPLEAKYNTTSLENYGPLFLLIKRNTKSILLLLNTLMIFLL